MTPKTLNISASFFSHFRRAISVFLIAAFLGSSIQPAAAQSITITNVPWLPKPGEMVAVSAQFTPPNLKGMVIHPNNAMQFDFLIDRGDETLSDDQKKIEYKKLIKYFLASLAVPDDNQWVNLSPYEKDRIIQDDFGKTEMGRDLLAQDYILKQITASLIYPESSLGQKFWDKVYAQAQEQFGTSDVPMNTFNKVWIVPDSAVIYEKGNMVYIVSQHLKVMLEEDYLSLSKHAGITNTKAANQQATNKVGSQVVREIVLPALEEEVNNGKNFAMLRQIFSGMLLSAWYKNALKESLLGQVYADKSKVKGVDQDPAANQEIYKQYVKAFKKGVFNYIKEDMDKFTNQAIPRKYFSGGMKKPDYAMITSRANERTFRNDAAALGSRLEAVETDFVEDERAVVNTGVNDAAMAADPQVQKRVEAQIAAKIKASMGKINGHEEKWKGTYEANEFGVSTKPLYAEQRASSKSEFQRIANPYGRSAAEIQKDIDERLDRIVDNLYKEAATDGDLKRLLDKTSRERVRKLLSVTDTGKKTTFYQVRNDENTRYHFEINIYRVNVRDAAMTVTADPKTVPSATIIQFNDKQKHIETDALARQYKADYQEIEAMAPEDYLRNASPGYERFVLTRNNGAFVIIEESIFGQLSQYPTLLYGIDVGNDELKARQLFDGFLQKVNEKKAAFNSTIPSLHQPVTELILKEMGLTDAAMTATGLDPIAKKFEEARAIVAVEPLIESFKLDSVKTNDIEGLIKLLDDHLKSHENAGLAALLRELQQYKAGLLRRIPAGARILVVDDDLMVQKAYPQSIRGIVPGVSVEIAVDGADALGKLANADFVITDVDMRGNDGDKLVAAMKASSDKRIQNMPTVVNTGRVSDNTPKFPAGTVIVEKPFEVASLLMHLAEQMPDAAMTVRYPIIALRYGITEDGIDRNLAAKLKGKSAPAEYGSLSAIDALAAVRLAKDLIEQAKPGEGNVLVLPALKNADEEALIPVVRKVLNSPLWTEQGIIVADAQRQQVLTVLDGREKAIKDLAMTVDSKGVIEVDDEDRPLGERGFLPQVSAVTTRPVDAIVSKSAGGYTFEIPEWEVQSGGELSIIMPSDVFSPGDTVKINNSQFTVVPGQYLQIPLSTVNIKQSRVFTFSTNRILDAGKDRDSFRFPVRIEDNAMASEPDKASVAKADYGGIDLNAANLKLQIKRDGQGVPLPVSQQDIKNMNIDGLIPVIMGIKPAMLLPVLSELSTAPAALNG